MSDLNASDGGVVPAWRERKNLLLGGLVGGAVLILVGYFLLFSGGGSTVDNGLVPSARGAGGAAASASPSPNATTTTVAVYKADPYGNPFKPLYPAKPTASASADATIAATAAAATGSSGSSGTGSNPAQQAPAPTSTKPVTLKVKLVLDEVTPEGRIHVTYYTNKALSDAEDAKVKSMFTVVNVWPDDKQATLQFGDDPPFTLSVGESKTFDDVKL